jgi:predicted Fe-Mo cluster-binding NifX family protein
MRVAISALGPSLDDRVDERFGRAEYLLLVDDDTYALDVVDNTANRDAFQGAGLGAAEKIVEGGATAVITGHLGPKAYRALQVAGVVGYGGAGMTAREAVGALKAGQLVSLSEGEAHSGIQ